eukprot:6208018-Pleurochrysis_carterae.AAC.2
MQGPAPRSSNANSAPCVVRSSQRGPPTVELQQIERISEGGAAAQQQDRHLFREPAERELAVSTVMLRARRVGGVCAHGCACACAAGGAAVVQVAVDHCDGGAQALMRRRRDGRVSEPTQQHDRTWSIRERETATANRST